MKKSNVKKNFLYQVSYEILIMILPLLTSPYTARILGAEKTGIYSYTYAITYYFTLFAALGIKNYGNREISRCRDDKNQLNKTFSSLLFLHFFLSAIVLFAFLGFCLVFTSEYKVYYLIQSLYLVGTFFDISWLFFGLELFKTTVIRNAVIKLLSVLSIFLFVKEENDLWIYVLILAASNLFSQLYLWFKIKPLVKIVKVSMREIFYHFPQMILLFIPTIAVSLYNYMDKIMLGTISGEAPLGFYENCFKITTTCSSVIGSVGTVMLPRMSNIVAKGDKKGEEKYICKSMFFVMFMACAMSFGISGIANDFAPLFWGEEFAICGLLLSLLILYLPVQAFASVLRTQYLIPNRMDRQYTISLCIGAVVNLIINLLLIPYFDAVGAAIGTLFAETSVCVTQVIFVRDKLPIKKYLFDSIPFVVIGTLMLIVLRLIESFVPASLMSLLIQIIIGSIIFLGLSFLYLVKIAKKFELINEALSILKIKYRFK